jgi:hypothetical protein
VAAQAGDERARVLSSEGTEFSGKNDKLAGKRLATGQIRRG